MKNLQVVVVFSIWVGVPESEIEEKGDYDGLGVY